MNEMNDTTSLQGNEVPPNPVGTTDGTSDASGVGTSMDGTSNTSTASGTPTLSYVPTGRVLQRKNGKIAGVAGGLADYFNVDVSIVRLAMVVLTILTAPAMPLAYILAWIVIPEEDAAQSVAAAATQAPAPSSDSGESPQPPAPTA